MKNRFRHGTRGCSIKTGVPPQEGDHPLRSVTQLTGNLQRFTTEHQPCSIEQDFVGDRANLSLDPISTAPTDEPGNAIPDADGSLVGVHASTLASDVGRRQVYTIAYMLRCRGTRRSGQRGGADENPA